MSRREEDLLLAVNEQRVRALSVRSRFPVLDRVGELTENSLDHQADESLLRLQHCVQFAVTVSRRPILQVLILVVAMVVVLDVQCVLLVARTLLKQSL